MPGGTGPASCASGEANQILGELAGVARRSALCQFSSLDSQDGPPQARTHVEGVAAARGDPRPPRVLPSRTLATCENIWPAGTSHAARVRLTAWRSRAENSGALRPRSSRIPSLKRTRTWQFTESPAFPARRTRQLLAETWCPYSQVLRQMAERGGAGGAVPGTVASARCRSRRRQSRGPLRAGERVTGQRVPGSAPPAPPRGSSANF